MNLEKVDATCNISLSASVLPCCVSQADTSTKHRVAHEHICCSEIPPQHIRTLLFKTSSGKILIIVSIKKESMAIPADMWCRFPASGSCLYCVSVDV